MRTKGMLTSVVFKYNQIRYRLFQIQLNPHLLIQTHSQLSKHLNTLIVKLILSEESFRNRMIYAEIRTPDSCTCTRRPQTQSKDCSVAEISEG